VSRVIHRGPGALLTLALALATSCGGGGHVASEPAETFDWVRQPISFSPPSGNWVRDGDNSGGRLGVRFILRGGGGQCLSVEAFRMLAERDPREAIEKLIRRRDSLTTREFLHELGLARPRLEDPISEREAEAFRQVDAAITRAMDDHLAGQPGFVASSLEAALRAATSYEPTLAEVLPHVRLRPERMNEPSRWRIGYERDTVLAGLPAFASDDTLITPERPLLYREVFWVVRGCAFKAVFQGLPENLPHFYRLIDTIRFPEPSDADAS